MATWKVGDEVRFAPTGENATIIAIHSDPTKRYDDIRLRFVGGGTVRTTEMCIVGRTVRFSWEDFPQIPECNETADGNAPNSCVIPQFDRTQLKKIRFIVFSLHTKQMWLALGAYNDETKFVRDTDGNNRFTMLYVTSFWFIIGIVSALIGHKFAQEHCDEYGFMIWKRQGGNKGT